MILGPPISRSAVLIFFTAVIYPVVKVHRRSGPAIGSQALVAPAVRWSVGSPWSTRIRGHVVDPDMHRRFEDLPANRHRCDGGIRSLGMSRGMCLLLALAPGRGGGDEETRTPDPLLAKEMLFQLSYVPVSRSPREVVGAPGLEPGTSALSGPRSNQLSYAPWRPA
jgi:hypothetical protein